MIQKTRGFKVFLNDEHIDTIFYSNNYFKSFKNLQEIRDLVKKSLVEHDGYNANIEVI